jgi:hypothetical protein
VIVFFAIVCSRKPNEYLNFVMSETSLFQPSQGVHFNDNKEKNLKILNGAEKLILAALEFRRYLLPLD